MTSLAQGTKEYVAGVAAGAAGIVVGYPLDTIKVRLQSSPPGTYHGMVHCGLAVVRREGVRTLYRGMSSPLLGGAVEAGFTYLWSGRPAGTGPSLLHAPLASAVSGLTLSFLVGPVELVTCRMQAAGGSRFRGPLHCIRDLLRSEGLLGLTRGLGMTMAREVPGSMVYFTTYEACKKLLRQQFGPPEGVSSSGTRQRSILKEALVAVISGGMAGCAMWTAILPIDVAKTRRQTSAPGSKWDVGLRQHLRLLWQEGGVRALYAGLAPTLVRAFPSNSAQFLAWEMSLHLLSATPRP